MENKFSFQMKLLVRSVTDGFNGGDILSGLDVGTVKGVRLTLPRELYTHGLNWLKRFVAISKLVM